MDSYNVRISTSIARLHFAIFALTPLVCFPPTPSLVFQEDYRVIPLPFSVFFQVALEDYQFVLVFRCFPHGVR